MRAISYVIASCSSESFGRIETSKVDVGSSKTCDSGVDRTGAVVGCVVVMVENEQGNRRGLDECFMIVCLACLVPTEG